jgi:hypothetical protein
MRVIRLKGATVARRVIRIATAQINRVGCQGSDQVSQVALLLAKR